MSYCVFRNCLTDLRLCNEMLTDELDQDEHAARTALIRLCHAISEQVAPDEADDLPTERD